MKQSPSLLLVDDEQANLALASEILRQAGYAVATASDGFKALAACKVRVPDLIVLDLHMPLMSGSDVFNRLRAEEKTRYIPVIFVKRKEEPPPQIDKTLLDEYPILIKPLEPTDLVAIVKTLLREKFLKDELRKRDGQIKELTLSDALTSLRNARYLHEFLKTELAQCRRYNAPLTLILVEPDQMKEVHKSYGQKGVDSVLVQLSVLLTRANRKSDICARSAASEFALVLPHTDRTGAVEVAERLRVLVADSTFTAGDTALNITVSLGLCQYAQEMDTEGTVIMSHARAALAQGHTSGGNVTLIAE